MDLIVEGKFKTVRTLAITGMLLIVLALSASDAVKAQQTGNDSETITVELVWQENRTSIVQIEDQQWTVRANSTNSIEVPVNTALRLSVVTPQETYHADEFLIIEPVSNPVLTVWLDGNTATFSFENLETGPAEEELTTEEVLPARTEAPESETAVSGDKNDLFTVGDVSLGLWKFDMGGCPCELGMEISTFRMGLFGVNYAEIGSGTIRHGITAGLTYRGYIFDDIGIQVRTYSGDAGVGYGLSYFNQLFTSFTLNIPIYFKSVTEITFNNETETTEYDDWFITDAMYLRFRNVFYPWIGRDGFFSSVSFMAGVDISLAENGGTNSIIGIGVGLSRSR